MKRLFSVLGVCSTLALGCGRSSIVHSGGRCEDVQHVGRANLGFASNVSTCVLLVTGNEPAGERLIPKGASESEWIYKQEADVAIQHAANFRQPNDQLVRVYIWSGRANLGPGAMSWSTCLDVDRGNTVSHCPNFGRP